VFPCPEGGDIWKRAAQIFIMGTQDLSGTTTVGLTTDRVFDRVHEGKRLTTIG
jgi:hypothetical protein